MEEKLEMSTAGDNFPVVLDTVVCNTSYRVVDELLMGNYEVLYIGVPKDTIIARHYMALPIIPPPPPPSQGEHVDTATIFKQIRERIAQNPLRGYCSPMFSTDEYKKWDSSTIQIYIDTHTVIKIFQFASINKDRACTKAYPVLLSNKEQDTIFIAEGDHVPIGIKIKNRKQLL